MCVDGDPEPDVVSGPATVAASTQRIDHAQERKAMEISIASADAARAVLAHQDSRMQVMHQVSAKVWKFQQRLAQYRGMPLRRSQQARSGRA